MSMTTRFRVLGGVEADVDGCPVAVGHARQRCVLAILLVDANRPVPVDTLVERVWTGRAPQRAHGAVHTYISRLRQAFASAADVEIRRDAGGYLLSAPRAAVDLHRFTDEAARARTTENDQEALTLFDEALRLWQGEAFGALDSPWLAGVRDDLNRQRLAAELDRNDIALRCGGHSRMLADLAGATLRHPFDERLAGQCMLALYRSGRQADALRHFRMMRDRLADELAAEPGTQLRELHRGILAADPSLDAPEPVHTPSGWTVPRQLPAVPRLFAGRSAELARLDALLPEPGREASAVVISALSGTAGIGKTALAVHWAHRVADRFPDGQLYVNLRGFDRQTAAVSAAETIIGFLDALRIPPERVPSGQAAQVALYRSVLADRRMLVVLDNARDADHVRPLLPAAPGCLALITSRDQLIGLVATEGAEVLNLDVLGVEESRDLLSARIGPDRCAAEPAAVQEIIARCARLPLALSIVAARAATHPDFPLEAFAAELRETRDGLDAFTGDGSSADVRSVFSWSYRSISAEAARLLRLLGLHAGPDVAVAAVAALAGGPVRPALAELTRAHLLTESRPGRYSLHDLLRVYAQEQALAHDTAQQRGAATQRMLDYYLHSAYAAAMCQVPHREPIVLAPQPPELTPERFSDLAGATAWFAAERLVLLRAIQLAVDAGFRTHAWQLAWTLTHFLHRTAHWEELAAVNRLVLGADPWAVHAHEGLAKAFLELGRLDEAERHLDRLLTAGRLTGHIRGQAEARTGFQVLRTRQRRLAEALYHGEQAIDLFKVSGPVQQVATLLNNLGFIHTLLGDPERALDYCRQSLALHERFDEPNSRASTWDTFAVAHQQLGHQREAIAAYRDARRLSRISGDRYREASVLTRLGDACSAIGDASGARQAWTEALAMLAAMNHGDTSAVRRRLAELD